MPIAGITLDYDGQVRHVATPDIGMDEGAFTAVVVDMAAGSFVDPPAGGTKDAGVAFSPQASFQNTGNVTLESIPVRFRIVRVGGSEVYNQTAVIASLGPGSSTTVTFPSASIAFGGSHTMYSRAEMPGDAGSGNDEQSAGLTIAAPFNHAPVLVDMADVIVHWGEPILISPIATDADHDPLIFSAAGLPPGASIDGATGRISWTPPNCPGGPYGQVTVIVMDPHKAADTTSFGIRELPTIVPICHVPASWANKLEINYPADGNHNWVEDQLEGLTAASQLARGQATSGTPVHVLLYLNACIGEAERDTIRTYAEIVHEFLTLSAMLVRTTPEWFLKLAGMGFVSMVAKNHSMHAALDTTIRELQVVPSGAYTESIQDSLPGIDGSGVTVAILDSGVDDGHATFGGAYIDGARFLNGTITAINPDDSTGHGTFNAGIILGRGGAGGHRGIAKGAKLVDYKIFRDSSGVLIAMEGDVTAAIERVALLHPGAVVYIGIEGDNFSYGSRADEFQAATDALSEMIRTHAASNNSDPSHTLAIVVPAGNQDGGTPLLLPPAVCEEAIVVSASADNNTVNRIDDTVAPISKTGPRENFGSCGADSGEGDLCPPFNGLIPHFAAPGTHIPGVQGIVSAQWDTPNGYMEGEGTSAAAAHVAGILALMKQFLQKTPHELRDELAVDADTTLAGFDRYPLNIDPSPPAWDKNGLGRGLINPYKTLLRLRPAKSLGFNSFGPTSSDIVPAGPIQIADSVRFDVHVHNKGIFPIVGKPGKPAFYVDLGTTYFGNSPFMNLIHTWDFPDSLPAGGEASFSFKWKVPNFTEPHGSFVAKIRTDFKDADESDNDAVRNETLSAFGSQNCRHRHWPFRWFRRWSGGCNDAQSPTAQPLAGSRLQESTPQDFPMWVANLLPENVQVTLEPTVVAGSGWTLACSESTFSFPMLRNEIPRLLAFLLTPGSAASDSYVVDIKIEETGACGPWTAGGGRLIARLSAYAGTGVNGSRRPALLMSPRPFRDHLNIAFDLPRKGRVGIRVYDVAGREVRRLDLEEQPAGPVSVRWDGRQRGGHDVSPGVYFVRIHGPDVDLAGHVVRLR